MRQYVIRPLATRHSSSLTGPESGIPPTPLLITYGTADGEDLPERTEEFVADPVAASLPVG
jgi:hypothetical protein